MIRHSLLASSRRTLLFTLLLLGLASMAHAVGTPHLVIGSLDVAGAGENDVTLEAYIASRPDDVLTQHDPGCGHDDDRWWIEVGNFQTPWQPDEKLLIIATNLDTGESQDESATLTLEGRQWATEPPGGGAGDDGDNDDGHKNSGDSNNCFIQTVNNRGFTGYGMTLIALMIIGGLLAVRIAKHGRKRFLAAGLIIVFSAFLSVQTAEAASRQFTLSEGFNAISMPLGNAYARVGTDEVVKIETALDLISAIDGCRSVRKWDAGAQRHVANEEVDFEIVPGAPYLIEMAAGAEDVLTLEGEPLPVITDVELTANPLSTNINLVTVPLYRTDIDTAEKLANEIPNCDAVWRWDRVGDGYEGHPKGTGINNFTVSPGLSYYVNVSRAGSWNQSPDGAADLVLTVAPHEPIAFQLGLSQEKLAEMTLPLSYKIVGVAKNNVTIFDIDDGTKNHLPEGVDLDENTGAFAWTPTTDQIGRYDFLMAMEDAEGRTIKKSKEINVLTNDDLFETQPTASPVFIRPAAGEESLISFRLADSAVVTIDLYRTFLRSDDDGEITFRREFVMTLRERIMESGFHQVSWDGRNPSEPDGNFLAPGAYTYVVTAETDDDRISIHGLDYAQGDVEIKSPEIAIVDSEGGTKDNSNPYFNPYAGDKVRIRYTLDVPAWVAIGGPDMNGYAIESAPRNAGRITEWWNGRTTRGETAPNGAVTLSARADLLPENVIVIEESPSGGVIADVAAEPYVMTPAYGDVCTIGYTLETGVDRLQISISDMPGNLAAYEEIFDPTVGYGDFVWEGTVGEHFIAWPSAPGGFQDYTVEIAAYGDNDKLLEKEEAIVRVYR